MKLDDIVNNIRDTIGEIGPLKKNETRYEKGKFLWVKALILTILAAFAFEIIINLTSSWFLQSKSAFYYHPNTYHQVWGIATLVGIAVIVRRIGLNIKDFLIIGGGTIVVVSIFVIVIYFILPSKYFPIISFPEPNYIGIASRFTTETHPKGVVGEDEDFNYPLELHSLYPATGCPSLEREVRVLEMSNGYIKTEKFLTWQAGLAYGYTPDPRCIREYIESSSLSQQASYFLTIGPFLLVELFIRSLSGYLIPMVFIQAIWYFYRNEYIWF